MAKLVEIKEWYIKCGLPLKCRYCGMLDRLTKDHVFPKSRVSQKVRVSKWKNKQKDPNGYFAQFALLCHKCNQMKANFTHDEFMNYIKKIIEYIK